MTSSSVRSTSSERSLTWRPARVLLVVVVTIAVVLATASCMGRGADSLDDERILESTGRRG